MSYQPFLERGARATVFVVLGAAGAWACATWLWPWCGPALVAPCPLATPAGCWAAAGVGAAWGVARAVQLDIAERRRYVRRLAMPRVRRISQPIPMPSSSHGRSER